MVRGARLANLEFLGGVDVLCVDKTGTLTQNRLHASEPYWIDGTDPKNVMLTACLTAPQNKAEVDALDRSLLRALKHYPLARTNLL